jgi:peptidoglycan/LPS O-acetylase OafA/YrhL
MRIDPRSNLNIFLNASRWIAAFLVVIGHARDLVLVQFADVQHKTLFSKVLYLATSLGQEGVVVFFVISGFLVGGLTIDRWERSGVDFRSYASARVSRIYTTLIPALLVCLILDAIGLHWLDASGLYSGSTPYPIASVGTTVKENLNLVAFLGTLFMVQGFLTQTFGGDGPLWSLSVEWWYYCLFALITAGWFSIGPRRVVLFLLALIFFSVLPATRLWLSVWLLGIAAYFWLKSAARQPHPLLGIIVLILSFVICRRIHDSIGVGTGVNHIVVLELLRDLTLGFGYAVALVSMNRLKSKIPFAVVHQRLAEFSYSTYLCHFPMLVFLVAFGYQVGGLEFAVQPTAYGQLYLLLIVATVYSYCFAFSLLTERYTPKVRKTLDRLLVRNDTFGKSIRKTEP